jgi:uncharacterized protein (TIGR03435 family)
MILLVRSPIISLIISFFIAGNAAICESAAPAFQSAEIHKSAVNTAMEATFRDGVFQVRSATMTDLIGIAWRAHPDNISGAPRWFSHDRYDVTAKAPADTPAETVMLMLRTLLAERFRLVFHGGEKPTDAFFLSVGEGGPKMKQSNGEGPGRCKLEPMSPHATVDNTYVCHNITMTEFATQLREAAGTWLPEPVINETGLGGRWDFAIAWTSKGALARMGTGVSVSGAVDQQLGLRLKEERRALPVFVVEHVEKPAGI